MTQPATAGTLMTRSAHLRIADLRGLARLAVDATAGVAGLVETLHQTIVTPFARRGAASTKRTRGITGLVYRSIGGVTRLVGGNLDVLLAALSRLLDGDQRTSPEREAIVAALNGVLGDHLAARRNPLAIRMALRKDGTRVEPEAGALHAAFPQAGGKVAVFVHGLCMNDLQWTGRKRDYGAALARDLGYTPLYIHYNTGLHISVNGRALSGLLAAIVEAWPCRIDELTIVGHSMGGLVARSACHYGTRSAWRGHLRHLVMLGAPHDGAPLERVGNWIDLLLGSTRYSAPFARLGKIRSAGITDLRHGYLLDEDWEGRDRFDSPRGAHRIVPLPEGVAMYAVAASRGEKPKNGGDRQIGDGLVPVKSALGIHRSAARTLAIPPSHRHVACGINHLDLLSDPGVYRRIRRWLGR